MKISMLILGMTLGFALRAALAERKVAERQANGARIEATHPIYIDDTPGVLNVTCSAEAPAGIRRRDPVLNAERIGTRQPLHCWPASATAAALDAGTPNP